MRAHSAALPRWADGYSASHPLRTLVGCFMIAIMAIPHLLLERLGAAWRRCHGRPLPCRWQWLQQHAPAVPALGGGRAIACRLAPLERPWIGRTWHAVSARGYSCRAQDARGSRPGFLRRRLESRPGGAMGGRCSAAGWHCSRPLLLLLFATEQTFALLLPHSTTLLCSC